LRLARDIRLAGEDRARGPQPRDGRLVGLRDIGGVKPAPPGGRQALKKQIVLDRHRNAVDPRQRLARSPALRRRRGLPAGGVAMFCDHRVDVGVHNIETGFDR
jgi:hypothetical protein